MNILSIDGFPKHLYFIFEFGCKFPNSGHMKVLLSDFSKRVENYLKPRKSKRVKVVAEINFENGEAKLRNRPNSAYIQIWLQTLTYATGIKEINDYDVPLCNC